ncbi:FAD-dependent monooxygenase [Asanoa sp. WMMD1127]|uniref:FAD-dependent monooxygenase n=1 Tax=Asanoa sp. WMMD1127 TaxID=3016107 RepID=UPI002417407D|nr:FAD-dependent monooxygenase [Asanoa sp. WMMD1127]MDG4820788.1 FAD-dependent monooxygenase [Asanoa sp. WMMD1127]
MEHDRIPVLIVGGGLAGLSTAAFLAWHGVPALLVERHAAALGHPRARVINPRTVELFRQIGLEDEILAARSFAHREPAVFLRAGTLAGPEKGRGVMSNPGGPSFSPSPWAPIDQDRLENLVAAHATRLGADIRYGQELVDLVDGGDRVTATLREAATGREHTVVADYLVAADGHDSGIRRRLGLELQGYGPLGNLLSLVFAADLTRAMAGRELAICHLDEPEVGTVLLPHDRAGRWVFSTPYHPERGETLAGISEQRCVELVRAAIGDPELTVELLPQLTDGTKKLAYSIAAGVADRYAVGRVLLVGDAAHLMPPSGAWGSGTGIQDAHNLAWKLAAVLTGVAAPSLLDTYEAERRPVALVTVQESLHQLRARSGRPLPGLPDVPPADYFAVVFGHRYASRLIAADGPAGPPLPPGELRGQPGTRAPHVSLRRGDEPVSTVDLYGRDFVLLTGAADWAGAAADIADREPAGLVAHLIGVDLADPDGRFAAAHGIGDAGAVLVRPDGVVAWRQVGAPDGDPVKLLELALDRALDRHRPLSSDRRSAYRSIGGNQIPPRG